MNQLIEVYLSMRHCILGTNNLSNVREFRMQYLSSRRTLCHSLVYSNFIQSIIVWGGASDSKIKLVIIIINNIPRTMLKTLAFDVHKQNLFDIKHHIVRNNYKKLKNRSTVPNMLIHFHSLINRTILVFQNNNTRCLHFNLLPASNLELIALN